jgi:hypothetical protein
MVTMSDTKTAPKPPVLTATHYGAAAGAVCGLILWALGTFVFKGSAGVPAEVTWAVYVLVPGITTGAAGFLTRRNAKLAG